MNVVAERRLQLRKDGESIDVIVKLGMPVMDESGENWKCTYEIWFGDRCQSMAMHGIDAMQALQLSIATLDVELEHGVKKYQGKLYFHEEPFTSMLECSGLMVRNGS